MSYALALAVADIGVVVVVLHHNYHLVANTFRSTLAAEDSILMHRHTAFTEAAADKAYQLSLPNIHYIKEVDTINLKTKAIKFHYFRSITADTTVVAIDYTPVGYLTSFID